MWMSEDKLFKLQNDEWGITVTISPEHGGEISSITVPFEGSVKEVLYRGNDFSEVSGWRGRAPLLWPAVGRSYTQAYLDKLKAGEGDPRFGEYDLQGKTLPIPIHGFAMRKPWEPYITDSDSILCSLTSDGETRRYYPFDFKIEVEYKLVGTKITATYRIISGEDGMCFSIGNHISFNLPLGGKGMYEDTLFRSSARKVLELTEYGMLSGIEKDMDFSLVRSLADETLHDMVTGGITRDEAYIELLNPCFVKDKGAPYGIRVSQREIPISGIRKANPDNFLLVLWGEPDKGYFCPEPWYGGPNSLNTKEGLIHLDAGEEFLWEMGVEFLV